MRRNYEYIIQNAAQEVEYVTDFLAELLSVNETRKLWRAWSGLLEHYVNAVSALRRATDQGKSKGWSDKLLADQKADPLLYYAFQARNAKHGFEAKREANPRAVSVGGLISISGDSSVTMSNNTIVGPDGRTSKLPDGTISTRDGRYAGGTIPRGAVREHEHFVILTDVKMRNGDFCPIPNPQTPPSRQAIEIARHVADWLDSKLSEAKEMANSEQRGI